MSPQARLKHKRILEYMGEVSYNGKENNSPNRSIGNSLRSVSRTPLKKNKTQSTPHARKGVSKTPIVSKNTSSSDRSQRRKQPTPKQRNNIWKEVQALQRQTTNLIPRLPFGKVIREVMLEQSTKVDHITQSALRALQEAAEMYLTQLFTDAYCCTLHRGKVTLLLKDMQLARYFRGHNDPGNNA